ncbi:zinc finger CCCH domain-containing protein 13-like isoform X2 [Telopea speciosissima]|uniref:zinc finger CCCH domain-containing protein 13-like isoform X2 n=1 Tax=Telopea speciosissima TaxID=54955 RepID=UPI001CC3D407|nr:zinc finger CCCH domain-containing protein 13-like isoform X2 [Telopea speciosissima]
MSGAPKRLHEEVNPPPTSKHPLEESSLPPLSVKISQSGSNEYPFELGPEGRLAKIQRTEARDADKRPTLFPAYRLSSSSNDSCVVTSENRMESKDSKENRDSKVENRDSKAEAKDLHTEARIDAQSGKGNFHSSWKEHKEHHKTKRYPETSEDSLEPWRVSRHNMHGPNETRKEASTTEERDHSEAHEAVGENKVDLKSEDKYKEKERKRKDEKQRDWGERDRDRNERRNNMQVGITNSERRESTREEREVERWERERKELPKDKERAKEREKDHIRKETPNGTEKEDLHNEKELMDGSVKIPEQENPVSEQKLQKEFDSWKPVERDAKEKRREKDADMDIDRHEKRSRSYEKESDDGCTEGDGGTDRERDGFGYGIQQRKRMLRPRGTPQVANREPRFRSRTRDNEGSQGKPEVSSVVYKAGECMQELIKLWKEFEESQDSKTDENSSNGPTLEIRVPAEYVTATNRQVRGGQLWGTDIYTDDSDLVAVLMHTGYCRPTASPPPPAIQELRATIRVLPPQDCYTSTLRNNVRSRAWGAAIGCSYRVERCCIVKKGGGTIDLEPCLTHTSAVEPTLAPVAVERTMTTRSAASVISYKFYLMQIYFPTFL